MLKGFLNFLGLDSHSTVVALQAKLEREVNAVHEAERKLAQCESACDSMRQAINGHLATAKELRKDKEKLERDVLELKAKLEMLIQAQAVGAKIREWCAPELALPAHYPPVPQAFQANTLHSLGVCLNKPNAEFKDSCAMASFPSPSAWGLYWILANATKAIQPHIAEGRENEDWVTSCFLHEIKQEAKRLESFKTKASLEINTSPIYASIHRLKNDRTVTERQVGADVLLMLAGKDLVPGGGIRIIWLQAKRNDVGGDPYNLNYWREVKGDKEDPSKLRQYEVLQGRHAPAIGEFALYTVYSPELSVLPAISIEKIPFASHAAEKRDCNVDLGANGERLQELLVRCATDKAIEAGQFSTSELVAHLGRVTKSTGIPMHLVRVHAAGDGLAREQLLQVSEAYQAALGIKTELVQKRERDQEHAQELALRRSRSRGYNIGW